MLEKSLRAQFEPRVQTRQQTRLHEQTTPRGLAQERSSFDEDCEQDAMYDSRFVDTQLTFAQ
jgi:hypothetical protein